MLLTPLTTTRKQETVVLTKSPSFDSDAIQPLKLLKADTFTQSQQNHTQNQPCFGTGRWFSNTVAFPTDLTTPDYLTDPQKVLYEFVRANPESTASIIEAHLRGKGLYSSFAQACHSLNTKLEDNNHTHRLRDSGTRGYHAYSLVSVS